ncbi:MAG: hypothetical protein ACI865_002625, partial [Flavobacteriaceae bacterium]
YLKTSACSNTSVGDVGLIECAEVGTPAFGAAGVFTAVDSQGASAPSPAPPCDGGGTSVGNWTMMELDPGVTQVSVDYSGGFAGAGGFSDMWMSFYQGPNCSSLTNVGCDQIIDKSGPSLILLDVSVSGLDPNLPLWVYTWGNKAYTADFTFNGTGDAPVNDNCAGATNSASGCNLGANGAAFTGPSNVLGAGACAGGTWYSNENTVFYEFTATSAAGTIDVSGIVCNDGTTGEAQVGVWTDCASVGTYGANFLGCAVGTGTLTLPTLTIGQTYIIAVDGQAGDACIWDFITTGIQLPVEFGHLEAESFRGFNRVSWNTISENNSSHFEVQRSNDGMTYESIQTIDAAENSLRELHYEINDAIRNFDIVYYRIKQVDMDGKTAYFGPKAVHMSDAIGMEVFPNPVTNMAAVNFDFVKGRSYDYQIVDLGGRVVLGDNFHPTTSSDQLIVRISDLQNGMYVLTITDGQFVNNKVTFVKE